MFEISALSGVSAAEFALLAAFQRGATLAEAFDDAARCDEAADLAALLLGRVVRLQTLVDFETR